MPSIATRGRRLLQFRAMISSRRRHDTGHAIDRQSRGPLRVPLKYRGHQHLKLQVEVFNHRKILEKSELRVWKQETVGNGTARRDFCHFAFVAARTHSRTLACLLKMRSRLSQICSATVLLAGCACLLVQQSWFESLGLGAMGDFGLSGVYSMRLAAGRQSEEKERVVEVGGRIWRSPALTPRTDWASQPVICPALDTALVMRKLSYRDGNRDRDRIIYRSFGGETAQGAAARARSDPKLSEYYWNNDTILILSNASLLAHSRAVLRKQRRVFEDPAVAVEFNLVPAENQTSPLGWAMTLSRPSPLFERLGDEEMCALVQQNKISATVASRNCTLRRDRKDMDNSPLGGGRTVSKFEPPWYAAPTVATVECAFVSSYTYGYIAYGISTNTSIFHANAEGTTAIHHRGDLPVTELDSAASIGTSAYLHYPGHFPNENLPRLVYLDEHIPAGVPLLYPEHPGWMSILREAGSFQNRSFVTARGDEHAFAVKRLYFFTSSNVDDETSVNFFLVNFMARKVRSWALRQLGIKETQIGSGVSAAPLEPHIVFLTRREGHSRSISNNRAIIEALRATFPGVPVTSFEPATAASPLRQSLLSIGRATLLIAPHGAGLNNIFPMLRGGAVLEIGAPSTFVDDYNCLSRQLGLRYFYLMTPNVPDSTIGNVSVADILHLARIAMNGGNDFS